MTRPRGARTHAATPAPIDPGANGEWLLLGADLAEPWVAETPLGPLALVSTRGPGKRANEDGALVFPLGGDHVVIAVVDGMGGMPNGDLAARLALEAVATRLARRRPDSDPCDALLAGFQRAQTSVLRRAKGAGATLVAALVGRGTVQVIHAGDAEALVVGQRGRVKLRTVAHSPTGHALAAGQIDEEAALVHDERHIVSNAIGLAPLVVEVSDELPFAPRDTLVLASDGLFDNLRLAEIVAGVRTGPVEGALERLTRAARGRMERAEVAAGPGKPDDLTVAVLRGRPSTRARVGPEADREAGENRSHPASRIARM